MAKKAVISIKVLCISLFVIAVSYFVFKGSIKSYPEDRGVQEALDYVRTQLTNEIGLIETYPIKADKIPYREDYVRESLSETVSMWLWILELLNLEKEFDEQLEIIQQYFLLKNDSLSWRIEIDEKGEAIPHPYGATIDDLRTVRALLEAEDKWSKKQYRETAMRLADSMKNEAQYKGYLLHQPMYDGDESGELVIDLSYLDLESMFLLSKIDSDWKAIYEKSLEVLLKGTHKSGFFYDRYNTKTETYFDFEKNFINQVICAIHLAEKGFSVNNFIQVIKSKWAQDGKIFGMYEPSTGEALVSYESIVVYALIGRLCVLVQESELYDIVIDRVNILSQTQNGSLWEGSYVGLGGHSFDHLQVLLTYVLERKLKNL